MILPIIRQRVNYEDRLYSTPATAPYYSSFLANVQSAGQEALDSDRKQRYNLKHNCKHNPRHGLLSDSHYAIASRKPGRARLD